MALPASDYTADELHAIWVTYQTQSTAACPRCGAVLAFELVSDSVASTMSVSCPGCGRRGLTNLVERNASE